jgi:CheY-like chemotaxis protein
LKTEVQPPSPFCLILADDDEDDRLFFKEAIEDLKINARLVMMNDGTQLMNYLNNNDVVMPKMIFLDINMPGKNGIRVLQEIRKSEKLKNLEVAMYSTSLSPNDIKKAFDGGADVYIKKPNDYDTLKKILNKAILANWNHKKKVASHENFVLSI